MLCVLCVCADDVCVVSRCCVCRVCCVWCVCVRARGKCVVA